MISFQISDSVSAIAPGKHFSLTCRVLGAENLNPSVTYQWIKNSGSNQILVGTNSSILSFDPVRLSDAANYSCMATIISNFLLDNITEIVSWSVRIQSKLQKLQYYAHVNDV